jgi:predicted transposase YdaD
LQQKSKNQTQIETIDKLRQFGLSDEQIAEALDIPLEQVKQVDFEE